MPRPDPTLIEPRFLESLRRYTERGVPTGGFLQAVLCNDLFEAMGRGDERAIDNLPHIVSYIYNRMPSMAHGSPIRVGEWIAQGGQWGAEHRVGALSEQPE